MKKIEKYKKKCLTSDLFYDIMNCNENQTKKTIKGAKNGKRSFENV